MKSCQNIAQLAGMFGVYAAWVVLFKTTVSVPCGELFLSSNTVTSHVSHVKNNGSKIVAFL
jgi:hypothetical protein